MPILMHELFFKILSNRGLFGINAFVSLQYNLLYFNIIYLIAPMWPKSVNMCPGALTYYNSNSIQGPSGSLN